MTSLPRAENPLVIRTDFTDDELWTRLREQIAAPQEDDFQALVEFLDDRVNAGLAVSAIASTSIEATGHTFLFLADSTTMTHSEHPVLVVATTGGQVNSFRVIPSEMWAVENNLSLGNMDFHEFADAVDPDGVFRGFRE